MKGRTLETRLVFLKTLLSLHLGRSPNAQLFVESPKLLSFAEFLLTRVLESKRIHEMDILPPVNCTSTFFF